MNENEMKVLAALNEAYGYDGFGYVNFSYLSSDTGLDRKVVRRACRSLARKGLAEYGRGLWTEDCQPAGSGYAATKAGRQVLSKPPTKTPITADAVGPGDDPAGYAVDYPEIPFRD